MADYQFATVAIHGLGPSPFLDALEETLEYWRRVRIAEGLELLGLPWPEDLARPCYAEPERRRIVIRRRMKAGVSDVRG